MCFKTFSLLTASGLIKHKPFKSFRYRCFRCMHDFDCLKLSCWCIFYSFWWNNWLILLIFKIYYYLLKSKLIIVAQIKMFLLACFGNAFKSNEYVQNSKAGIWSWGKRWSYTENRCWIFMEQWKEWILTRELQGRSFPFYIRSVRNQVLKEMSPLLTIYTTRDDNDIHHLKKLHGRKWPEDFLSMGSLSITA